MKKNRKGSPLAVEEMARERSGLPTSLSSSANRSSKMDITANKAIVLHAAEHEYRSLKAKWQRGGGLG